MIHALLFNCPCHYGWPQFWRILVLIACIFIVVFCTAKRKHDFGKWNVVVVAYSHSQQTYICFVCFGSTNNKFFQFLLIFSVAIFVKESISYAETSASEYFRRNGQIVYILFENALALFMSLFIVVTMVVWSAPLKTYLLMTQK